MCVDVKIKHPFTIIDVALVILNPGSLGQYLLPCLS
uniref:Uncharacterized protein n=1 Tax=Zea mays TaxID=4577 RepID=C4J7D2_MAIZE|nr:unknown [Zea mays]